MQVYSNYFNNRIESFLILKEKITKYKNILFYFCQKNSFEAIVNIFCNSPKFC